MLVDAEKAKQAIIREMQQAIGHDEVVEDAIRAADLSDCRLSPPRDDLEKAIVLSQDEIDALEWTWGMGDLERALQNLELERRALFAQVAEFKGQLAGLRTIVGKVESNHVYSEPILAPRSADDLTVDLKAANQRIESLSAQVAELREANMAFSVHLEEANKRCHAAEARVAELKRVLRIACPEDIEQSCDECAPGPCAGCWVKDARLLIAAKEGK